MGHSLKVVMCTNMIRKLWFKTNHSYRNLKTCTQGVSYTFWYRSCPIKKINIIQVADSELYQPVCTVFNMKKNTLTKLNTRAHILIRREFAGKMIRVIYIFFHLQVCSVWNRNYLLFIYYILSYSTSSSCIYLS